MERNIDLNEISDGRFYTANDMVRADCQGCEGCSVCCHGMGKSILLDPLDVHRICTYFRIPFEALLADHVELNVVDGMILPNLKMAVNFLIFITHFLSFVHIKIAVLTSVDNYFYKI